MAVVTLLLKLLDLYIHLHCISLFYFSRALVLLYAPPSPPPSSTKSTYIPISVCKSLMESTTAPAPQTLTKLSKTFRKIIPFKKPTKSLSNDAFCLLLPTHDNNFDSHRHFDKHLVDEAELRNRAAMEAFLATLFATISSLKAAYAELQAAQFPYNGESIQCADQAVVDQLKALSELKRSFVKKQIDSTPPHVTLLLAEIQEQQALMKMYEITMNKMEREIKSKDSDISSFQKQLLEAESINKSIETKLNSSGCFSIFNSMNLSDLTIANFIDVLHYTCRSIRNFVKLMIRDMELAHWDIDAAVNAIERNAVFPKSSYRCFAFESYVAREIFEGFGVKSGDEEEDRAQLFHEFKRLKSLSKTELTKENPKSSFVRFLRSKYMRLLHPKMELSFYGNLGQRKSLNAWKFPETAFFGAFTEMARRVWVLRCLALSFGEEVSVFQMRKGCQFSEVYMKNVADVEGGGGEVAVAFTVVPGFKIGKTVVQSQVYVSPARR